MKRILCILSSLDVGGAETFLMKVARALPPDEYQLDFVVSRENGYYTQEVLERGGRIFTVPLRTQRPLAVFRMLQRIVKENGYQSVLKLGNSPLSVTDLIAAKKGGAKYRILRSCNALTGRSWMNKALDNIFRPVLNYVANVKIAPSRLAAEYTFGRKQVEKGNVHLLNNGVDLSLFRFDLAGREKVRRELKLEDKLIVGHIGRFNKQKNHEFLLDVFQSIRKKNDRAVLVLVGQGELEQTIREKAEALELADHIVFTGIRSDIPQMLSAMDVFVFPSFHEGMPNTVIEAQATGLPCVIADTITRDANITGLVEYLSLDLPPETWAEETMVKVSRKRKNTEAAFWERGYDIKSSAERFCILCFGE